MLSDKKRRKEYDDLYGSRSSQRSYGFGNAGTTNNGFPGGFSSNTRQEQQSGTRGAAQDEEEEDEYDESSQHEASGNFFKTFASMFGGGGGAAQNEKADDAQDPLHGGRPDANGVFGDVFEDMWVPLRIDRLDIRFPDLG